VKSGLILSIASLLVFAPSTGRLPGTSCRVNSSESRALARLPSRNRNGMFGSGTAELGHWVQPFDARLAEQRFARHSQVARALL